MRKLRLDVLPQDAGHPEHKPGSNCCRTHMVICPGYGDENFKFPTVEEAVNRSLARLEKKYASGSAGGGKGKRDVAVQTGSAEDAGDTQTHVPHKHQVVRIKMGFIPGLPTEGIVPPRPVGLIPQLPESVVSGVDATLFAAAEGIRLMMDDGKYDAIVAERFDDHADKVTWAKNNLANRHPKYLPAIESLEGQLAQLRKLYHDTLPRVLSVLAAQNPNVSDGKLLEAAVEVLDDELIQILSVLRIWTDAFGQLRSGNYKQLEAVVFSVEQAFRLFEGEEPATACGEGTARLKTSKFHVGNVFVARFSDQGPATLPGTRGPVGAHAIEVPHDERNIISLMLVLYLHEFRHDIFADVEGLAEELTMVVARSIREACETGKVQLSQEKALVGKTTVRLSDLLVKLFADNIGEVDADISGGILLSGPAYLYNMVSTFSAFNSKRDGVFNTERLLRTGSYYGIKTLPNDQKTLQFWPHPPDYIRAHIVAAALDNIGFPEEAQQCRLLADQAVGSPLPEFITWRDENPKSKDVIKIATADIKAVAPVVADALINTKLESLGGLSTREVINWTKKRQEKVDVLVKNLMRGSAEVPADIGDVFATYVAAAATLAYWGLVKSGMQPRRAATLVDSNALKMLDTVRQRFDDQAQGFEGGSHDPEQDELDQAEPSGTGLTVADVTGEPVARIGDATESGAEDDGDAEGDTPDGAVEH